MGKTLQQVLGGRNLSGVIQGIKTGVPRMLPPALYGLIRKVEGDYATYRKVNGTRKMARVVQYGSPSRARTMTGVSEIPVKLLHTLENIQFKPHVLVNLESSDGQRQRLGESEVLRETQEFNMLFDNLRASALVSAFSLATAGKIHFDSEGNLLPTSSGAAFSVDYSIPAGNQNQLDVFGAGAIISASWATSTTDIIGHIEALKAAAVKKTGYPLMHALYGKNILKYLLGNDLAKALINNHWQQAATASRGLIPQGFCDLQWWPVQQAFMEAEDGTQTDWFGADHITFMPDPDPTWFETLEGSYPVPTTVDITAGASEALASVNMVNGKFAYGQITTDPVGLKEIAGDTFLPVIKVPGAVFLADVTP